MAVAFQSVSTAGWVGKADNETFAITKPTGVAVGDLLIAHLVCNNNSSDVGNILPPGGWSSIIDQTMTTGSLDGRTKVYYRVADASDVAASDYTFTYDSSSGGNLCNGSIYRIDGQGDPAQIQSAVDTDTSGGSPSYTNTATPLFPDSLLLLLISANGNSDSGSLASYAIATDNPTWTERVDSYGDGTSFFGAGAGDSLMGGATASRTAVTATGNSSCGITGVNSVSTGVILIIPPLTNATVSPSALEATFSVPTPAISGAANVTISATLDLTISVQAPTVSTPADIWTPQPKGSSGTWTNQTKNP